MNDSTPGAQTVDSWPCFGCDDRNSGAASTARGPGRTADIEWTFDGGTPTMNSSPVVVENVVYATRTGDPGGICAVDATTGDPLWRFETEGYISSAPAVSDGVLYAGMWGRTFYAVDIADGTQRWKVDVGHRFGRNPRSPVGGRRENRYGTLDGGDRTRHALVTGGRRRRCLRRLCERGFGGDRRRGGSVAIDFEADREDGPYVDSSPAVAGSRVFIGASDGWLRAIGNRA